MVSRSPRRLQKLPERLSDALPTQPSDLEGYDRADIEAVLSQASASFARARTHVGLLLWALRQRVEHGEYGAVEDEWAERFEVDPRTIRRWRLTAETEWDLAPPSPQSASKRSAVSDKVSETPARPRPKPSAEPERVAPSEVLPPPPPELARDIPAKAVSGKVTPVARHEQLSLPLEEASTAIRNAPLDELIALPDEELQAMAQRIDEARRAKRRLAQAQPDTACDHPKAKRKVLGFGAICDKARGGCGALVR